MKLYALLLAAPLLVAAILSTWGEDTAPVLPAPALLTREAAGYYCQMMVLTHEGPKGQVFLADNPAPLWFGQVRDGLAYLKSPEQEAEVLVLYVSDMAKAPSYADPGADNWINAKDAFYVVGSDALGGMGAPELVPFGDAAMAAGFASEHGGNVLAFAEVSSDMVLAPLDTTPPNPEPEQ